MDFLRANFILEGVVEDLSGGFLRDAVERMAEAVRIDPEDFYGNGPHSEKPSRAGAAKMAKSVRKAAQHPKDWWNKHQKAAMYRKAGATKAGARAYADAHKNTVNAKRYDEATPDQAREYARQRAAALTAKGKTKDTKTFSGTPSSPAMKSATKASAPYPDYKLKGPTESDDQYISMKSVMGKPAMSGSKIPGTNKKIVKVRPGKLDKDKTIKMTSVLKQKTEAVKTKLRFYKKQYRDQQDEG